MSRSWLDSETTRRKYKINSDPVSHWIIQNEYQKIKCPQCNQYIFGRLTRIWEFNPEQPDIAWDREIHLNYNVDLENLKNLLITYPKGDIDEGITEEQVGGIWKLMYKGKILGEELK